MTHDFKADLDVSISFLKQILPYELGGDVAKHLDILFKAALQRNDVPFGVVALKQELHAHFDCMTPDREDQINRVHINQTVDYLLEKGYLTAAPKPTGV